MKYNYLIKIRIYYLIIVIVFIIFLGIIIVSNKWKNQKQDQVKKIISRGELRVSTINSPIISFNDKQEATGFDYELTKRFADCLGVKLRINVYLNINQLFNNLENGNSDFITAGLLYNQNHLDKAQSGPAYYSVSQQLIYRKGMSRPHSLVDIKGKFVVATDSVDASTIQRLRQEYPNLQWEETSHYNTTQLLQLLAERKIDYTLENSIVVAMQQRIHPNIAVAFNVSDDHSLNWYMKRSKDNSLNSAMLAFFNESNQEKLLTRLDEKYFSHISTFDYFDTLFLLLRLIKLCQSINIYLKNMQKI